MKERAKVGHLVIFAAAVTLLPLGLFTSYLSVLAFGEGRLLREAPTLPSSEDGSEAAARGLQGTFYKVQGLVTGDLLNPPEYPEIQNALWYRVTIERRVGSASSWIRDHSEILVSDRVKKVFMGQLPIDIGSMARLALPVEESYRKLHDNARYAIESKPIPKGGAVIFGLYQGGVLTDGVLDRLIVTSADHFDETVTKLNRKGLVKGFFLGGIGLVFLGLSFVIGRSAWLGQTRSMS
jgi:hypothetical protein